MKDSADYRLLLRDVITVAQASELSSRWDVLIREVFAANGVAEKIKSILSPEQNDALMEALAHSGIRESDSEGISQYLRGARSALESLPMIKLKVAADLPEYVWVKVSNWLIQNLKYKVLLDVEVVPDLIGGVIIENDGKSGDYSLRKTLVKHLTQNKVLEPLGNSIAEK